MATWEKTNLTERVKMVKAMEFIARQVNDECVFDRWLMAGVADGDIEYGDLSDEPGEAGWYTGNGTFRDLMSTFLRLMASAKASGGLYCNGVTTREG